MHIIQEEIGLPKVNVVLDSLNRGVFEVSPLPEGYGVTLGNTFRRVLLSSLPGVAIVAIKVEGASHEYEGITGLKDSVLDLILNLKGVSFSKKSKGQETIVLEKKGEGLVKASDIKSNSEVEVLNPDYVITELSGKNASLKVDIIVEKNVGYSSARSRLGDSELSEFIQVDSIFSPVSKVKYDVESTRVGSNTNLNKLILEIETNGSMTAYNALRFSSQIITSYFSFFDKDQEVIEEEFLSSNKAPLEEEEENRSSYTPIEVLNFSPRTLNALINGELGSIEQLVETPVSKLTSLRGFGKKAMDEVKESLDKKGLSLKYD